MKNIVLLYIFKSLLSTLSEDHSKNIVKIVIKSEDRPFCEARHATTGVLYFAQHRRTESTNSAWPLLQDRTHWRHWDWNTITDCVAQGVHWPRTIPCRKRRTFPNSTLIRTIWRNWCESVVTCAACWAQVLHILACSWPPACFNSWFISSLRLVFA